MRLTLVYPSVGRKENQPYVRAWQMQPLSMAVLASLTPQDVEVRFYDDRMEEIPFDEPTDLVAISVETFTALRAYKIARQFRMRGVPVVFGGYHVTLIPQESAAEADAIIVGDAEPVWSRVLNDARRGELQPFYDGRSRRTLAGVRPKREIFAGKRYQNITLVEFARGCNFNCDFCSITAFHKASQNHRPAAEVAAEMEATGRRRFFIVDDNIVSQPQMARALCRELIPLSISWVGQASIHIAHDDELLDLMVKSGCKGVLIGMESLDPLNLRDMGKEWNLAAGTYADSLRRFRDHGLAVYGTFVFGYDNDDADTIRRSVEFAIEQKLFLAAFNQLIPFPGTPLYQRLQRERRLIVPKWWLNPRSCVGDVTFRPKRMQPEELQEQCLNARRQFYRWGSIFRRMSDFDANLSSPSLAAVFLGLNLQSHFDVDLRQGLQLGAGLNDGAAVEGNHIHDTGSAVDNTSKSAESVDEPLRI